MPSPIKSPDPGQQHFIKGSIPKATASEEPQQQPGTPAARAHAYAKGVVAGKILACKWVKKACQRHMDDLERAEFRYRFDAAKANRVCRFIECMPHTKGEWAGRGECIHLEPWQAFIICSLFGWVDRVTGQYRFREAYVCVPRKQGKALALDTPIPTPSGWTSMGEVSVGDRVIDEHGNPCNVVAVTDVFTDHDCYEISFSNGEKVIADAGHEWLTTARINRPKILGAKIQRRHASPSVQVVHKGNREYVYLGLYGRQVYAGINCVVDTDRVQRAVLLAERDLHEHPVGGDTIRRIRTTEELYASQTAGARGDRNHCIDLPCALNLPDAELPIEPYVLGFWLGDGSKDAAVVTSGHLDKDEVVGLLQHEGYAISEGEKRNGAYSLGIQATELDLFGDVVRVSFQSGINFKKRLRKCGVLNNKHVPSPYLRGSIEQRLALVQGLMDTDGTVDRSGMMLSFTNTNEGLVDSMSELLASLGIKSTKSSKRMRLNGEYLQGLAYTVQFHAFRDEMPVFRLRRKLARMRRREDSMCSPRSKTVQIVSVTPVKKQPVRCIQVDSPSHLYLFGRSMLPTHNSQLAAAIGHYKFAADGDYGAEVYCLAPSTPVLCSDLSWRPIGDLSVGEELVAFDEFTPAKWKYRKFHKAVVESFQIVSLPSYRVTFDDGGFVVASSTHGWFGKRPTDKVAQMWMETKDLRAGSLIRCIGKPWGTDNTHEGGYLAGMFDGEGCIGTGWNKARAGFRLQVSQKPGVVLDEIERILKAKGFKFSKRRSAQSGCCHIDIQSLYECFRLLGEIRPRRLVAKAQQLYEGRAFNRNNRWRRVSSVEFIGDQKLVGIKTSTGTLIADGMMSHNSGATSEKQAWEVFRPAKFMAEHTPAYRAQYGVEVNAKSVVITSNGSRFEPVIGKPGDGSSPSCAIVDEYHEHSDDSLYDTMKTGMGARRNPLLLVITTAGSDRSGPCYALQGDVQRVLDGTIQNERLFGIIYTIDTDDLWTSEKALIKANPNYNVSVSADFLKDAQRDAINSARKQNAFKTKHLNVWVNADVSWMNMASWDACADPELRIEDFNKQECFIGLDLASRVDIASKVRMFRRIVTDESKSITDKDRRVIHYFIFATHYLNEGAVANAKSQHYSGWAADGRLVVTPGNVTDLNWIAEGIIEDTKQFVVKEIPHDPYQAEPLFQALKARPDWNQNVEPVAVAANVLNFSGPMKELEGIVLNGQLHHDGDPVLGWMISNVVCHRDAKDNIYPRKEREENKIDGAVATIMALNRALANQPKESVYERRGLRSL